MGSASDSRIKEGTHPLLFEYVTDSGNGNGFGYDLVKGAGSYELATAPVSDSGGMIWTIEPEDGDDPDSEVTMSLETYAHLLAMARVGMRYTGCTVCERVTQVG